MDLQQPFDAAVVISTILRPTLRQTVRSVFAQDLQGRIQIMIGVDKGRDDHGILDTLRGECPSHIALSVVDMGYSTSQRHGGLYSNYCGGSLKTALSYLANSRRVAYVDDDNWWAPDHLSSLLSAIEGKSWAYSLRTYVDAKLDEVLCRDDWESVGPGRGVYVPGFGGFVDTNCYMLDKIACHDILPVWSMTRFEKGVGEDRMIFERIKSLPCGATGRYTVFYRQVLNGMHPYLLWKFKQAGVDLSRYMPPDRIPADSVWDECARHDAQSAQQAPRSQPPTPLQPQQPQPVASTRYAGAPYSITYPKR